jgi:tetratricopeptide (TPR) repeat protein
MKGLIAMRHQVTIGLTIIAILFFGFSCSGPGQPGQSQFEKGFKKLRAGQVGEAREILEAIAEKYPESPVGDYAMAEYYAAEGLAYEALNVNQKALKKDETYLPALKLSAKMLMEIEQWGLAFFAAGIYQKNGGDPRTATVMETEILLRSGKIWDAATTIRTARETDDCTVLMVLDGFVKLHQGDIAGGLELCREAGQTGGDDPETVKRIGDFYRQLGLLDTALSYYEDAMQTDPNDFFMRQWVVESLIAMKYLNHAEKLLKEYHERVGISHWYHLMMARILEARGKIANAEEMYGMARPHFRELPTVLTTFAKFRMRGGGSMIAEHMFGTAVELASHREFSKTVQINLLQDQTEFLIEANMLNQAGPLVEQILNDLPNDFRGLSKITTLFWMFGRKDSVDAYVPRVRQAAEGVPAYQADLAALLIRVGKLEQAREVLDEIFAVDKFNLKAIAVAVDLAGAKDDHSRALEYINSLDEYVSYDPVIASKKLKLYEKAGELTSALEFSRRLIGIARHDLSRYRTTAELLQKAGDTEALEAVYQDGIEANPDAPDAHYYRAQWLYDQGRVDALGETLDRALSLDTAHSESLVLQARLAADQGRVTEAIELLDRAVKIDQYNGPALSRLALLNLETDENPMVALNYANKAKVADDSDPLCHYAAGRANLKMERYKAARVGFLQALEFAPDNPEFNYYAGLSFFKDGDKGEAGKYLEKALRLGLAGDLKTSAQSMLN